MKNDKDININNADEQALTAAERSSAKIEEVVTADEQVLTAEEIIQADKKALGIEEKDLAVEQKGMVEEGPMRAMAAVSNPPNENPKGYPEAPFVFNIANAESVALSSGTLQHTVTDFVLPGKNGFDLRVTRKYDSLTANTVDADPNGNTARTVSRINEHNIKQYGLGFGWEFTFPSIEVIPAAHRTAGVEYPLYLHLEDGRNYEIVGNTLKEYTMTDITVQQTSGAVTHPLNGSLSQGYNISIGYLNGNTDYFRQFNDASGGIDCYRLAARKDRFGNTIFFTYSNGNISIVDTWGRTVALVQSGDQLTWTLPDNSTVKYQTENVLGGKKLTFAIDTLGRKTGYTYTQHNGNFRYYGTGWGDPGITMPYMLLTKITHPTDAATEYLYGISTTNAALELAVGTEGRRQYFPIRLRKDVADGFDYNSVIYNYALSADIKYINTSTIYRLNNVTEIQTFNDKGQLLTQELRENNTLLSSGTCIYGETADTANYKLLTKEVTKQYNSSNVGVFIQKTTDFTYTADKKASIEKIKEIYADDASLNKEVSMKYGAYGILTEKNISSSTGVTSRESYTLRNDNKVVEYRRIYQGSILQEKTQYIYGTGSNDAYCVTKERRYYGGKGAPLENAATYYETQFTYNATQFTSAPVKVSVQGMKDVNDQNINPIESTMIYDVMGRVISQTDADGFTTSMEYDTGGRVTRQVHPEIAGVMTQVRTLYDDAGNTVTTINEKGVQYHFTYTKLGQVKGEYIIHASEHAPTLLNSFTYDILGRTITETSHVGGGEIPTTYTYDAMNRVTSKRVGEYTETDAYTEVYTDSSRPGKWLRHTKTVQGSTGAPTVETTEYFDQAGRKCFSFAGNVQTGKTEYDNFGNVTQQTNTMGYVTNMFYDYAGRCIKITDNVDGQYRDSHTMYDELGNKVRTVNFKGAVTDYLYDAAGRLLRQTSDFDNERRAKEEYFYDGRGNTTLQRTALDSGWRETSYEYDARGRQTATIQWTDTQRSKYMRTEYVYDAVGNKTKVTTGLTEQGNPGRVMSYTYDVFNNVVKETDALDQVSTSEYDVTGRLLSKTDRNGTVMNFVYDTVGRLIKRTAETVSKTTSYYPNGRVKKVTTNDTEFPNTNLSIEYIYDNRGRIIQQNEPDGITKTFEYDNAGNRTHFVMKKSGVVAPIIELWYSYNIQGRLTEVKRNNTVITQYIYDTNGQKIQKKMPVAGLDVLYGYNTAGYLVELVNRKGIDVVSRFKYTYDLDGNQKTKNDNFETAYVYDKLGRLVSETEELGNTYVYEFDEFSNRTKLTVTGLDKYTVDYTYDANNSLLKEVKTDKKAVETSEYEYDANGNRVEAYTETIHAKSDVRRIERHSIVVAPKEKGKASIDMRAYNAFGELVQIYRDAMRVHYVYRPDGLRHSKQQVYPFKPDLNQKTTHYWDGQDIVAETNATGAIKATYLRGAGSLIAQVIGQDLFYYLHNTHGDVVQRISEAGVSAPKYKYDAFGNERNRVVTDPNPFRYCGEYYDAELQEIYLRARSYDPLSGRFTQEDPAKDGNNWYGYANNNPVRFKDPSGLVVFLVHGTNSSSGTWNQETRDAYQAQYGGEVIAVDWSGGNSDAARQEGANDLVNEIQEYARTHPGEPIIIVGHSHGGNVAILTVNELAASRREPIYVELLVTIATPVRYEYQLTPGLPTEHRHFYNNYDPIQFLGSISHTPYPTDGRGGYVYLPSMLNEPRIFPYAINTPINSQDISIDPYTGNASSPGFHSMQNNEEILEQTGQRKLTTNAHASDISKGPIKTVDIGKGPIKTNNLGPIGRTK